MDCSKNLRYFTKPYLSTASVACFVIAAAGAVIAYFTHSYTAYIIGAALAFLLCAAGFILSGISVSDKAFDAGTASLIESHRADFRAFAESIGTDEAFGKHNVFIEENSVKTSECYLLDTGVLFRKCGDGRLRSSRFSVCSFVLTDDHVILLCSTYGLTEDRHDDVRACIPFSDIESVSAREPEGFGGVSGYKIVTLKPAAGESIVFPKADDADLDELVNGIRHKLGH